MLDPENHPFLMETNLPTPMTARVYVNLPEGNIFQNRSMVLCVLGILWEEQIDGSMCLGMPGK